MGEGDGPPQDRRISKPSNKPGTTRHSVVQHQRRGSPTLPDSEYNGIQIRRRHLQCLGCPLNERVRDPESYLCCICPCKFLWNWHQRLEAEDVCLDFVAEGQLFYLT